ncbi:hypothetical protein IWW34DRAFT_444366 [Fusarium oxysporum f. sp. albedinis]|nr:hypothetical protein IWW34DRAFT_444366 [Fusarium oxysporum f. sp. albedinis]KAK2474738.1 hypothetical protein H9L39_14698 [Fusarium oxysporum f. sp. albedinis]
MKKIWSKYLCSSNRWIHAYGAAQRLDDPVPTFGAKLVTAPYTPALPFDIAGPDTEFLERLDQRLRAIGPNPVPKCLQGLRVFDPEEEDDAEPVIFSDTDSESDEDNKYFQESPTAGAELSAG